MRNKYSEVKAILKYLHFKGYRKIPKIGAYEKTIIILGYSKKCVVSVMDLHFYKGSFLEFLHYMEHQAYEQLYGFIREENKNGKEK